MYNRKKSLIAYCIVIFLLFVQILQIPASAVTSESGESRASAYLSTYSAYIYPAGNGKAQVWFDVQGTGYMDEIGALSIQVYECSHNSSNIEDWTWKKTFTHDSTPGMLSYNDDFHYGYVEYNGTVGMWYKAYVCVWGGKDGKGDTRYFWTYGRQATAQAA